MSDQPKEDDLPPFQIPHPERYQPTPPSEHTERWLRKDARFEKKEEKEQRK